MPPSPAAPGPARPAAVVNREIRALWQAADGGLSPEAEERYRQLLVEWAAAVREGVVEAA